MSVHRRLYLRGHTFWHGWLMIGALLLTGIPPLFLSRAKIPVAILLHDKAFYACADMDRANWMSNGAGAMGLVLVALGFWWADSLAALLISLSILRDGWANVAKSLSDVMDHHPVELQSGRQAPVVVDVHRTLRALPFVAQSKTLMREHGRYLYAEIFIQPNAQMPPAPEASRLVREAIMPLDWRLIHLAVEFTDDLEMAAAVLTREELDIESA
jgi:divalent metal cation (Fe/Co/Zn/Cd) transporter